MDCISQNSLEDSQQSSQGSRRLSSGAGLLGSFLPDLSDDDNNENDSFAANLMSPGTSSSKQQKSVSKRLSTAARRRSSFGARRRSSLGIGLRAGKKERTLEEQQRLVDIYRMTIKLNSENKVSTKNAWNLDLIDNMGEVLELEGEDQDAPSQPSAEVNKDGRRKRRAGLKVNFQKASCALEAGVKIYSCRVDDTHTRSIRILENLSRNSSRVDDAEQTGTAASSRPSRYSAVKTLESNEKNLNMSCMDSVFDVDPLFHKMSKTFDEGGAKGMLLANLAVAHGCRVVFDSNDSNGQDARNVLTPLTPVATDVEPHEDGWDTPISLSSLKLNPETLKCQDVDLTLCPQLESIRGELSHLMNLDLGEFSDSMVKKEDEEDQVTNSPVENPPGDAAAVDLDTMMEDLALDDGAVAPPEESMYDVGGFDGGADFGFDVDEGILDDEHTFDLSFQVPGGGLRETVARLSTLDGADGKRYRSSTLHPLNTRLLDSLCTDHLIQDEYKFFDKLELGKNQWAGAAHWKFASLRKPEAVITEEGRQSELPSKKPRKKQAFSIDFFGEPVDMKALKLPQKKNNRKNKTNPTLQTTAALTKAINGAERGDLQLPKDTHVEAIDLVRLFLRPSAFVSRQQQGLMYAMPKDTFEQGFFDMPSMVKEEPSSMVGLDGNTLIDDYDGNDFDYGAGGDFDEEPQMGYFDEQKGFIPAGGLVSVDRKVEKIQIKYAKTSKKVDVRLLKKQLWSHINDKLSVEDVEDKEWEDEAHEKESEEKFATSKMDGHTEGETQLSFTDVISNVSQAAAIQEGVTVPFYFICVLHLANEKGLHLGALNAMDDFTIKSSS